VDFYRNKRTHLDSSQSEKRLAIGGFCSALAVCPITVYFFYTKVLVPVFGLPPVPDSELSSILNLVCDGAGVMHAYILFLTSPTLRAKFAGDWMCFAKLDE
jgi:hypothetical protein